MAELLDVDEARRVWRAMPREVRAAMRRQAREGISYSEPEWTRIALSQVRRDRMLVRRVEAVVMPVVAGVSFGCSTMMAYIGDAVHDPRMWSLAAPTAAWLAIVVFAPDWAASLLGKLGLVSGLPIDRDDDWSAELGVAPHAEGRSVLRTLWMVLAATAVALVTAVLIVDALDHKPDLKNGLKNVKNGLENGLAHLAFLGAVWGVLWLGSLGWSRLKRRWRRPES